MNGAEIYYRLDMSETIIQAIVTLRGKATTVAVMTVRHPAGDWSAEALGSDELIGMTGRGATSEAAVKDLLYLLEVLDAEAHGSGQA